MRTSKKKSLPFTREVLGGPAPVYLFKCSIAGELWRYALVTTDQMTAITNDKECAGYCSIDSRHIYICDDSLNHEVIIHELGHAFFDQTSTLAADLTADQVEEVMCEIIARHWMKIVLLARVIYENLSRFATLDKNNLNSALTETWAEHPPSTSDKRVPENLLTLIAEYDSGDGNNPFIEDEPLVISTEPKRRRIAKKRKPRRAPRN